MNIPTDLKYTDNDEWIRVEGSTGTIGITDYAQDQLSDVVFVEIIVEPDASFDYNETVFVVTPISVASGRGERR